MKTRRWALCACCALLLASGSAVGAVARDRNAPAAAPAASYCPTTQERQFLDRINAYRRQHGKGPLTLSVSLGAAARFHSQDLANRQRIKGHRLTNGDGPLENMRRFGFDGNVWGENIAWEAPDAETVFSWWKKSPEHNRNMLKGKFHAIGIGFYHNANTPFANYWTTDFGDRGGPSPQC